MNLLLLAIVAYVAAQIGIGYAVSRRIRSEDDYLVAGRRMGPWLATGTLFATWFGAETCLGGAGAAYADGVSAASAEPFAYGLCMVFLGLVFALPLWKLRLTTLPDFFRARYSPGVERLAAVLMIPTSLFWAAAQIRAFGQVLASVSELESSLAIVLAAALVVLYTYWGGLLADALTDLVQGVGILIGLAAILLGVVAAGGGWAPTLERIGPESWSLVPEGTSPLDLAEAWCVPILGSVVAQELVSRVSAARSARVARNSALAGGLFYVAIGLVPVFLGLAGRTLAAGLEDGEQVLPELAGLTLHPIGYALFAGALVSAILSTVDSTLLACSSLLAHNLILPRLTRATEHTKVRLARAGVLGFGVLATLLALRADGVSALVHEASSFGSAGLFVILFVGLFTRRGGAASAYAALALGLLAYLGAVSLGWSRPFLTSLAASLVGVGVGLLAGRRGSPA